MGRQASGLHAWVIQRISAIYLLLYFTYLFGSLVLAPPQDVGQWRLWVGAPLNSIALVLFFTAMLMHIWVGLRDVFIDYLHQPALRIAALILLGIGLLACGVWAVRIVGLAYLGGG